LVIRTDTDFLCDSTPFSSFRVPQGGRNDRHQFPPVTFGGPGHERCPGHPSV